MKISVLSSASTILLAICSCATLALPASAQSSTTQSGAVQTYPKTYFDQFRPQTARDMIERLPGFTIDTGEDLRGFGSGAGNVLINGARPSSKTGGVEDALERISASSVERIDLIRGSAGASETAGQSVVANVITVQNSRTARWELQLERAAHGKINTAVEFVLSQPVVGWNTSTKINAFLERRPLDGSRISRDATGLVTFSELESRPSEAHQLAISSEAKRAAFGGSLMLTGRYSHTPGSFDMQRLGFDGGVVQSVPDQRLLIGFERVTTDAEIGIDWTRSLSNDWTIKFLSLSLVRDVDAKSLVFLERPVGVNVSNSLFDSQQETFETVARATLGQAGERRLRSEFGAEVAYNRLNSNLSLRFEDASGVTDIELPAANVLVEELRGEAFANLIWKATEKFSAETGVGAELSKISVSGDADNTQTFFFVKPFATLIYDPRPGVQFRLDARRTVGQLDFTDFAASASAADDRLLGGNPELGPDQTTRLSSSIDLRSEARGALNVEVFHEWRDDVLEQTVLPSGVQGLGNAGSARVWGVKSTASLPLSAVIPGGLLELEAELRDSTFADPIITASRSVSSIDSADIFVQFRQDLPERKFAWGLSYRAPLEGPFFFADEISLNRDGRSWGGFIETNRFSGLKANLEFTGIGEQNFSRERQFFAPDRSGVFEGSQVISRDRGMFVTLTVSGQF
ncbi:MAG: TonB-dependent receptor [Parvularculaceae bacterium]